VVATAAIHARADADLRAPRGPLGEIELALLHAAEERLPRAGGKGHELGVEVPG
jgi:hypothetical protein